jgi:mannitol/fructose-specific phosphotransferase system IIA component (Ntr-type)
VALGVKRAGLDFGAPDNRPVRIIVLAVAPREDAMPAIEFMAALGTALHDPELRERIVDASYSRDVIRLLEEKLS